MGKHKAKTNPKTVQVASKKREIESCTLDRTSIKIGDCVLVRVEGKNKPDVAKVNKVVEKKKHGVVGVVYCITWYLWPEDTKYGRLSFQGKSELLSSNWSGTVSLESIEGKCTVHTIDDYKHIEKAGPEDFFSRTRYNHTTKDFIPGDTLPVYCWCRRPYNPDYPLLFCEKCNDWFHPKCVGIKTLREVNRLGNTWLCPKCRPSESATASLI